MTRAAAWRHAAALAALAALAAVAAAPAPDKPCDKMLDQRQNGSENYRLNIDGVVIAVAPADSLLAAASEIDLGELLDLGGAEHEQPAGGDADKPDKPAQALAAGGGGAGGGKATRDHQKKGLKARLASLLLPLLARSRQHRPPHPHPHHQPQRR